MHIIKKHVIRYGAHYDLHLCPQNLSTSIKIYLPLSKSIYLYQNLSTSIKIYLPLSKSIYLYQNLSTSIKIYLPLSTSIKIYLPLSKSIYLYLNLSISMPNCTKVINHFTKFRPIRC